MTLDDFRAAIGARGDRTDVWLVYLADPIDVILGGEIALALQQAFWTRGEAYARARPSRGAALAALLRLPSVG